MSTHPPDAWSAVDWDTPADYNEPDKDWHLPQWEALGRRWCRHRHWQEPLVFLPDEGPAPGPGAHTAPRDAPIFGGITAAERHMELAGRYACSVLSPATVAWVAAHCPGPVVDPMAGTGYWAYCLSQAGTNVLSFDLHVTYEDHPYCRGATPWAPILQADAPAAVHAAGPDATLLLAWPPHGEDVAARAVAAYQGQRVVYVGEWDGATGGEALRQRLVRDWDLVAGHLPVCWGGIHDRVFVFERRARA